MTYLYYNVIIKTLISKLSNPMARVCDICGRGPQKSQKKSHSNIKTIRRQYLNLQKKNINGKQKNVCVKCIRTMKKELKR